MLELKEEEYQAIQDKQYLKADSLKNEIISLTKEIEKLSEQNQVTTIVNEEMKEKSDSKTMIKCLTIICTMMQSVTTITPTLRSLMQIALDSLDVNISNLKYKFQFNFKYVHLRIIFQHPDDAVHILAIKAVSICCILDKELAKQHIMMLFLQFSLEQENPDIWIVALKGIFDLLLLHGLEYFDISEKTNEISLDKTEKSRTKLFTDTDKEVSVISLGMSEAEKGNYCFIKILAGLLDNEVCICTHTYIYIYN